MQSIQVLILNHRREVVDRFSRHGAALVHYQRGTLKSYVEELSEKWFSVGQACIVAHHTATMVDDGEKINVIVAVNPYFQVHIREQSKPKGKHVKYLFVCFDINEQEARTFIYQMLKPLILANHPIYVDVNFRNIGFI